MKVVMKFGGSSVGDYLSMRRVVRIVAQHMNDHPDDRVILVLSAMKGVTDRILAVSKQAAEGDQKAVVSTVKNLTRRHKKTARDLISNKRVLSQVLAELDQLLLEFERVLIGVSYLKELTLRSQDYLLSFGERLSTNIIQGGLRDEGLETQMFTGGEAGIITDENYGSAVPLMNVTTHQVRERLLPLLENQIIPVITGFIGSTQHNDISTLGRGGSDYSATIVGYALDVDEVWIWTDVDGLMTADPKVVASAKTISSISFPEAMELVYFGAKAMHPKALEPAVEKGIPVRIKNTFNLTLGGTLICKQPPTTSGKIVKAVTIVWNVALVTISGAGMIGTPGVAAQIFTILGQNQINILMISQGSSEANISIIIRRNDLDQAVQLLEFSLLGKGVIRNVSFEDDVCVIAVVGAGMRGTIGVASRIFKAVADNQINVRVIAQGSSELNVSFVVGEKDGGRAVQALHSEFQL
jgi:aspartate kinase